MPEKQRNPLIRLLDYAQVHRKLTVTGCLLAALNAVLAVAILVCVWFMVKDLVSVAPDWAKASDAEFWGWLVLAFAVAGVAMYFVALMRTHPAAFRTSANMRKDVLAHPTEVPLGYFDENATGQLRRVIERRAAQTEVVLAHKLPDFVAPLVTPVAFLVVMFSFDRVMGLACLVPIAVSFLCMYLLMGGKRGGDSDAMCFMLRYQDTLNKMNKTAVEYVRGIPVVMVFQQTVMSFKAFHKAIVQYRDMAADSLRHIEEIVSAPVMGQPEDGSATLSHDNSIELADVTFSYPGSEQPAAEGMDKKIPAGSTVALVGPSGGGKTTTASLVPRFWDPEEGSVTIGGIAVRNIPEADLMDRVAFVFQNDRLFKASLLENIRASRPEASRREVEVVTNAAQCNDVITKFPDRLDTVVGSHGVCLSGGELQRIALARAILKDSPTIVLDEATAFADPENEALIQKALSRLTKEQIAYMNSWDFEAL